jgi:hypothetical protein
MPVARVLAVGALAVAVGLLLWVLSNVHSGSTSSGTTASTGGASSTATGGGSTATGSTGGTKSKSKSTTIPWKGIHLTIYNGYDPTAPAAGDASQQLKSAGWTVDSFADTSPPTGTTATYIAYPPGDHAQAKVVGKRLHITKIVPLSQAPGVPSTTTTVAVVLGPDGLPSSSG